MRHLPSSFCGLNSSRASGWSSRIKLSMLRNATTKRNDEKLETSFFFARQQGEGSKTSMSCLLWRLHILPLPLPLPSLSLSFSFSFSLSPPCHRTLFFIVLFFLSFLSRSTGTRHIYLVLFVVLFILSSALLCFTLLHFCLFQILPLSLELNIHVHPTDSRRVGSNTLRLT